MAKHIMLDLECLATKSNSVIVSIGAVAFNLENVMDSFYRNVSIDSCLTNGLVVDQGSLKFWLLHTTQDARQSLFSPTPVGLREALSAFTCFFQQAGGNWLWSHGSNYDIPILASAYNAIYGNWVPWDFRKTRDTRTLYSLLPPGVTRLPRGDDKHNALADANYQALCVQKAYHLLGKEMEV